MEENYKGYNIVAWATEGNPTTASFTIRQRRDDGEFVDLHGPQLVEGNISNEEVTVRKAIEVACALIDAGPGSFKPPNR